MRVMNPTLAAVLALCLLAPGPARSQAAPGRPDDAPPLPRAMPSPALSIVSAAYGLRSSKLVCAATQAVKQRCQGRLSCEVSTTQQLCPAGEKPPSVLIPTLTVTYVCMQNDTARRVASTDRPLTLRMSCAGLLRR